MAAVMLELRYLWKVFSSDNDNVAYSFAVSWCLLVVLFFWQFDLRNQSSSAICFIHKYETIFDDFAM